MAMLVRAVCAAAVLALSLGACTSSRPADRASHAVSKVTHPRLAPTRTAPTPGPQLITQWLRTSKADIDRMYVDAARARSDKDICDPLYEDAMDVGSWLPAPDATLSALIGKAANDYYLATQACSFGVGLVNPELDRGDASMRLAIKRAALLGISL